MALRMLRSVFMDGLGTLEAGVRELVSEVRDLKLKSTYASEDSIITVEAQIENMSKQSNLVISNQNEVLVVASVKRKTIINGLEEFGPVVMLTAIVTSPKGEGTGDLAYSTLFDHMKKLGDRVLVTRTLSTNVDHIHVLKKNGFLLSKSIPSARNGFADSQFWVKTV